MREITFGEAVREALREEMTKDETVFIYGMDIGVGFPSGLTKGLREEFGADRVRDTPICEQTVVGIAVGAALMGMRPVPEIQFSDLLTLCMDQIVNQAAKLRYMSGGQITLPITIRTAAGFSGSNGAQHSQSLEAWFMHVPGLKVIIPSTPADAKGLLKSSIRDDNPVLFLEHKMLNRTKGAVPEGDVVIPLGKADIKRPGKDITLVTFSHMVHRSLTAAETLEKDGIDVEVIDLRTLAPLDEETLLRSIRKTHRLVVLEEGCKTGGVGAEISAIVAEEAMDEMDAPIRRVAAYDTPIPFSPPLEKYVIPDERRIESVIRETLNL